MTVTVANLMERIEAAGLPERWVRQNILPNWWDADCDDAANHNPAMMAIVEIEFARAMGLEIETLRDEDAELTIRLDYASKALVEALKPDRRASLMPPLVRRI